jgi:hypothetical protein
MLLLKGGCGWGERGNVAFQDLAHEGLHATLASSPPGVIFRFNPGSISLGYEVAMGFRLAQNAARLNHLLKTTQQGVL